MPFKKEKLISSIYETGKHILRGTEDVIDFDRRIKLESSAEEETDILFATPYIYIYL